MPTQVRAALVVLAVTLGVVGALIAGPWPLSSTTAAYLAALASQQVWGVALVLAAGLLGAGAMAHHGPLARVGLVAGTGVTAGLVAAMWLGWWQSGSAWTPIMPWLVSALPALMIVLASTPGLHGGPRGGRRVR